MNNPDTLISVLLIASISLDVFSSFQDLFQIMLNYELHLMLNYEIQFLGKKLLASVLTIIKMTQKDIRNNINICTHYHSALVKNKYT